MCEGDSCNSNDTWRQSQNYRGVWLQKQVVHCRQLNLCPLCMGNLICCSSWGLWTTTSNFFSFSLVNGTAITFGQWPFPTSHSHFWSLTVQLFGGQVIGRVSHYIYFLVWKHRSFILWITDEFTQWGKITWTLTWAKRYFSCQQRAGWDVGIQVEYEGDEGQQKRCVTNCMVTGLWNGLRSLGLVEKNGKPKHTRGFREVKSTGWNCSHLQIVLLGSNKRRKKTSKTQKTERKISWERWKTGLPFCSPQVRLLFIWLRCVDFGWSCLLKLAEVVLLVVKASHET